MRPCGSAPDRNVAIGSCRMRGSSAVLDDLRCTRDHPRRAEAVTSARTLEPLKGASTSHTSILAKTVQQANPCLVHHPTHDRLLRHWKCILPTLAHVVCPLLTLAIFVSTSPLRILAAPWSSCTLGREL